MGKEILGSLELNRIYQFDCLEGIKLLPDNSISSIVTDPPYELGFMGKSWDSTGIAYNIELWKECLRVLKPGGHLLAFGGTRTYHRMAVAIEDAGFEIRDQMQWIYGSGFPKSHNISKAIDKKLGVEREVVGEYKHPTAKNGNRTGSKSPYQADNSPLDGSYKITAPATDSAKQWEGWGTALKPANEPIVVARKPISEKTIADNVLKWGVGGINIDDNRITYASETDKEIINKKVSKNPTTNYSDKEDKIYGKYALDKASPANEQGRFPANVIFDEEAGSILDEQSGVSTSKKGKPRSATIKNQTRLNNSKETQVNCEYNDTGGASRFFYCAKASKKDKGDFNSHPTVKPIKLMEHLVKLFTPKDGIVLDPFSGSGTTLVASKINNIKFLGFESIKEYIDISNTRLDNIEE